MKILKNILAGLLIIIVLFLVSGVVFVRLRGKLLLEEGLSRSVKQPVKIGQVSYLPPLGVKIRNLKINGAKALKLVTVQFEPKQFLSGRVEISKLILINPIVEIVRKKDRRLSVAGVPLNIKVEGENKKNNYYTEAEQRVKKGSQSSVGLFIKELKVYQGRLTFNDRSVNGEEEFVLNDVDLKLKKIRFPFDSIKTMLDIKADIEMCAGPFAGSKIKGDGWVNWYRRDLDATLKIMNQNGDVGITADLKSIDNDLEIDGTAFVSYIGPEPGKRPTLARVIVGALKATGLEIESDFAFKTKLDDLQLKSLAFAGKVDKINEISQIDWKQIGKQIQAFGKSLVVD